MSAVLNDRDAILQAATVRIVNPKNAFIDLASSAPGFHVNAAGQADLNVVTITAKLTGLDAVVAFTAVGGTLSNATDRSVDVTYGGQAAIVTATVKSNGDEFKRSLVIPVLRDGAAGTGTPGAPGARGAGHYYATGSTWSDVVAQAACPGSTPVLNDVVTISSSTYVMEKRWTGTAWIENGVVINGKLIAPDSILTPALAAYAVTTEKLAVGAVTARTLAVSGNGDNIVADPQFKDLAWWGRIGTRVNNYASSDSTFTFFRGGASLVIEPNGNVEVDTFTDLFPIEPGGTYKVEFQINLPPSFSGNFSAYLNVRPFYYDEMNAPRSGVWPNGDPSQFTAASEKGTFTYTKTITIPNDSRAAFTQLRLRSRVATGYIEIGSFSITRMVDASLVVKGGIKADHIDVDRLAAIIAYLGSCEIGAGGSLRQGMSAFNVGKGIWLGDDGGVPKLAIGDPGGAGITWDGVSLIVNKADLGTFTATLSGGGMTSSGPNGTRAMGSRQITGSGGRVPYRSVSWTVTDLEGNPAARVFISGDGTDTVSVTASGTNATARARVTGTVIDANGLAASASFTVTASFGAV